MHVHTRICNFNMYISISIYVCIYLSIYMYAHTVLWVVCCNVCIYRENIDWLNDLTARTDCALTDWLDWLCKGLALQRTHWTGLFDWTNWLADFDWLDKLNDRTECAPNATRVLFECSLASLGALSESFLASLDVLWMLSGCSPSSRSALWAIWMLSGLFECSPSAL